MQRRARDRCRHAAGYTGCTLLVTVSASAAVWAAAERPGGGRAAVPAESSAPRTRTQRIVYTCIEPGLVTFADTPCGPAPEVRRLVVEQPPVVTPPAALDDKPAAKAVTRKSEAPRHPREEDATEQAAEAQAQTCERLARTLRDLDARMRAGYSAREAGRLWDRWRETRERLREAGC